MGTGYWLIAVLAGGIVGWVSCFFVMKNNPKYFDLVKMGKEKLEDLKKKVDDALKNL